MLVAIFRIGNLIMTYGNNQPENRERNMPTETVREISPETLCKEFLGKLEHLPCFQEVRYRVHGDGKTLDIYSVTKGASFDDAEIIHGAAEELRTKYSQYDLRFGRLSGYHQMPKHCEVLPKHSPAR